MMVMSCDEDLPMYRPTFRIASTSVRVNLKLCLIQTLNAIDDGTKDTEKSLV